MNKELITEEQQLEKQIRKYINLVKGKKEVLLQQLIIFEKIKEERLRQDNKWGVQNHSDEKWTCIAAEEFGECAKEVLEQKNPDNFNNELIQLAAVIVAWLECRLKKT